MIFTTESGSVYEVKDGYIRRTNPSSERRADNEWVMILRSTPVVVGDPVIIELESLSKYGPDSFGNVGDSTTRTTSAVTEIIK